MSLPGGPAKPSYQFDADGKITGGPLVGLSVDLAGLRKDPSVFPQKTVDGPLGSQISAPMEDPYKQGGSFNQLKFSSDGKLYGVVGTVEQPDGFSNEGTVSREVLAPINGWTYDTSALPAPTPQGGKFGSIGGAPGVSYYDANFLPDTGGNLIEVLDGGSAVGYARQKLQQAISPDVRGRNRSYLGSDPRMANTGPDTRRANPGQNR